MKKRLVTSALPYVNNIPHLGNLIQVLSADVFARFCRQYGYETMYVCGTDEYGTATETRALQEGVTPKELCDRYHQIHKDIYQWFEIDFNHFGRTSTPQQTEIVQHIFNKVDEAGYISEKTIEQLFCQSCDRFLADRYVHGTCPHCGYEDARGDQCEDCGKLLDPTDLVAPRCGTCGSTPEVKKTHHLYIDLPKVLPKLQEWMKTASVDGFWANNAIKMTESWIRDGLKERCITRDLKWGIPVPKEGFMDKVFYVWFDAPIGYISITACLTDQWEQWWRNPDEVELFQFIGKDNIPFHTVIFPSSQLATGETWTKLHHMSSSEYLNYETGKFSKSKGIGVFGTDCKDTGIPADAWRFYIFYNRPETSDFQFTWKDFQEKINSQLIGNLSNLVNRTLSFLNRFYDGLLPQAEKDEAFWQEIVKREKAIAESLDRAELKDAFHQIFALSSIGNKAFQDGEPWRTRKENPEEAAKLLFNLVYLVRDLSILVKPYLPATSAKIASFLGVDSDSFESLAKLEGISQINKAELLFKQLEDDQIEELRTRYSGSQEEREQEKNPLEKDFNLEVELTVGKILSIERHPEAEKLYVETIDLGEEEPRTIVSGLVPYYSEEELQGKSVIVVSNLKPAKLRGVKSQGMLLAAEAEDKSLEVLFTDQPVGTPVQLQGFKAPEQRKRIKINRFFELPIEVKNHQVMVGEAPLTAGDNTLKTEKVSQGDVG